MSKCIQCRKKTKGFGLRCYSCANSGENASNYIDGRTNKKCYCRDCGKELKRNSYVRKIKRCRNCWKKFKKENKKIYLCKICNNPVSDYRHLICWKCSHPGYPICIDCGKKLARRNAKRCKSCTGKLRLKENSPNWLGGISQLPYPFGWRKINILIRKRDEDKCVICSRWGNQVHHIDYNKQNCKKDNLITLCNKCHAKSNGNRDYWFAYFTYIMENFIYG